MTIRSDGHQCEVCGAYGFFGFKQTNGDYHWYCLHHRLEGYKLPNLAPPPPELKGQLTFDLNVGVDGMETFKHFIAGNKSWSSCYKAYVKALPAGTEGMAEDWRLDVEKYIGAPSNPNLVGSAALDLKNEGYLDYVRHIAPRDRKSHGSKKALWKRTNR